MKAIKTLAQDKKQTFIYSQRYWFNILIYLMII